jgi:hypothetical protein
MTDSKDELRARFNQTREEPDSTAESPENTGNPTTTDEARDPGETENTENTEDRETTSDTGNTENNGDPDDTEAVGKTGDTYDWSEKYNYPFYMPPKFADELDHQYNQYDAKNKLEGGDGLEKHREFLFPIMQAAINELELDEVVDWQVDT